MNFLFTNMLKQFFIEFNWNETKDSYYWMKIHLTHDSKKVQ